MNICTFTGRLGSDPEVRQVNTKEGDKSVCNFNLAVKKNRGQDVEWIRCVVWNKQAESCNMYLTKGSLVAVVGEMQTRKWQDNKGIDRYTTEIVARNVEFLESKNKEEPSKEEEFPF